MDFTGDSFNDMRNTSNDYASLNAESRAAHEMTKINRGKIEAVNFDTKMPENSPYTKGRSAANFKPDYHSVQGAKKADF